MKICAGRRNDTREFLGRIGEKGIRDRVLELEKLRDGYYSDDTTMHAYALYHMAMIPSRFLPFSLSMDVITH